MSAALKLPGRPLPTPPPARRTRVLFTDDEYLEREARSSNKHEFRRGEIYAMAGGTPMHCLVCGNVIGALKSLARPRGCRVFTSDLRIHVPATGTYTYPDASVVCGPPETAEKDRNSLVNPLVLVEVLSASTEDYDRGDKFDDYRSIPSLREVLFLSLRERLVQHHRRVEGDRWLLSEHRDGAIELPALGGVILLEDLYENVDFESAE